MTNVDVVVGLQWGDEGKGKIVDLLVSENNYDIVIRGNGGNNAGHSISANGKTYAVHAIPSGIFQDCVNIIGPGCVVNPVAINEELTKLKDNVKGKLVISDRAPLVLSKHIKEDNELEDKKGSNSIGTTLRGIGPAYASLKNRTALFAGDLLDIEKALTRFTFLSKKEQKELRKELENQKELIGEYVGNIIPYLKEATMILIEGAQATMLDNLYGTYPYVTSSNTIVSSLLTGTGLNHKNIRHVYGVTKFYTTRVGNGPFITEMKDKMAKRVQRIGKEEGVSTGRIRRCGWIDLVQLKYAIELNGVTDLCMMKSDVMDTFKKIKICVAYENKDEEIDYIPFDLSKYKPKYKKYDGWKEETFNKKYDYTNLPENLEYMLKDIEEYLGVTITYFSTGPGREATTKND